MGLMPQRMSQELCIYLSNEGIFMRFPQFFPFILLVNGLKATFANRLSGGSRLTPSTDASIGASHYFNKVVRGLASSNFLHEDFCALQATGHCNFYGDPF